MTESLRTRSKALRLVCSLLVLQVVVEVVVFDTKFLFEHQMVHLNEGLLYFQAVENAKKVVHL